MDQPQGATTAHATASHKSKNFSTSRIEGKRTKRRLRAQARAPAPVATAAMMPMTRAVELPPLMRSTVRKEVPASTEQAHEHQPAYRRDANGHEFEAGRRLRTL